MLITPIKTSIFKERENLIKFIKAHLFSLKDKAVLVITSKIVALSEGRTVLMKNEKTKDELIKKESEFAIKTRYTWLTIKDGTVMSSAGIDESNANGKLILLPKDSFKSASMIRRKLKEIYRVKNLGVIISDSRLLPLRAGIVGVALGYAGFKGTRDYRGLPDIFGRIMKLSQTDVADSLAAAAVLLMGEADEKRPLAIIENAPVEFTDRVNKQELYIDPKEDIYRPLFENLKKIKIIKS